MNSELIVCDVTCIKCEAPFTRHVKQESILKNGKPNSGSYCPICNKINQQKRRGKTSEEMMADRSYKAMGVKVFSKEEIAKVAAEYGG